MGIRTYFRKVPERFRQSLGVGWPTPASMSWAGSGTAESGADYLARVERLRRDIRRHERVPASAIAVCSIGLVELLCVLALLKYTAAGAFLVDAFPRSIVVQIGILIVLPLLAAVSAVDLGNRLVARVEATRRIACPRCRRPVPVHAPWECPHCFRQNTSTSLYSFLNRCGACRREPKGCYCEHCGSKIALTRAVARAGGDGFPCARPIGRAPAPAAGGDAGEAPRPAGGTGHAPAATNLRSRDDPRHELIEAFALPESASAEEISAAFDDSKDSDAKTYLARQREALERASRAAAREIAQRRQAVPQEPPAQDDEAETARQRVALHLGAGAQASWSELAEYFDQADSDTKASMDPEDAQRLQRMAGAESKAGAVH
jgi:hypothetical protein